MIKKLHIQNFKSIKDLKLDCARVNVFIGGPNTGKSNILEGLGMFSLPDSKNIQDLIRMDKNYNIFRNENTDIKIIIGLTLTDKTEILFEFDYNKGEVIANCIDLNRDKSLAEFKIDKYLKYGHFPKFYYSQYIAVRYYKFAELKEYKGYEHDYLTPPFGENLPQLIRQKKELQEFVRDLFSNFGYKVEINKHENLIKIYREGYITESIPYYLTSDTLQRIIFYNTAIETSKEAILLFEEPEAHVFPFYNKFLAEKIALYNTNQFFIATHNPTFLLNLIEKTPDNELCVFITYYDKENYETKVVALQGKEADRLLEYGSSAFMNLNRFYEQE